MIFIDAVKIDERLASHLVGSDPFLRDQLISLRFSKFAIAAPVLELDEPTMFVVVLVSHGSHRCFDGLWDSGIRTRPHELAFAVGDLGGVALRGDTTSPGSSHRLNLSCFGVIGA